VPTYKVKPLAHANSSAVLTYDRLPIEKVGGASADFLWRYQVEAGICTKETSTSGRIGHAQNAATRGAQFSWIRESRSSMSALKAVMGGLSAISSS
jgi:hypothetical protein